MSRIHSGRPRHLQCLVSVGFVFLVLVVPGLSLFAQVSIQTLLTNGPASNRVSIVFLAEGYTLADQAKFGTDASNAVNALLDRSPFKEYGACLNAQAIFVPSAQAGADHPSYGLYRNTYFNSSYDTSDRVPFIPADATGQGKVDALLAAWAPETDFSAVLVNDRTGGASDGAGITAVVAIGNSLATWGDNLTHECGHLLGGLGDEYTTPNPSYPDVEEPNTTRETRRDFIKWKAWIDAGTPVPTPTTYSSAVGLFQGAHYHTTGWYRPKLNCLMKSTGVPFCEVCREALVLAIYRRSRPIDRYAPAATNLQVTAAQPLVFNLSLVRPEPSELVVEWFLDGARLIGETNRAYTLFPQGLARGPHVLTAKVSDKTSFVRTDPTQLLAQSATWNINVNLTELRIESFTLTSGGGLAFRVVGNSPNPVAVQSSVGLNTWVSVSTNTLVNGAFWYTNSTAGSTAQQFYRAVTPPP